VAEPYRQQIGPQSVTEALRGASPDAFGAQVGAAVERGAGQIEEAMTRARDERAQSRNADKQLELQSQMADATVQVERFSANQDTLRIQARNTAGAGGAGYTAGLLQAHDTGAEAIVGAIDNEQVRDRVKVMLEQRRAQTLHDGEEYEAVASGRRQAGDAAELRNLAVGRVSRPGLTDAERLTTLAQVRESGHTLLDHVVAPPEVIAANRREFDEETANAFIRSLSPQSARTALDGGRFDADLSPETRQSLNGWITARQQHEEALVRSAAEAQAGVGRAQARNMIEDVGRGVQVDPAQIDAAIAEARAGVARGGAGAADYEGLQHDLERARVGNAATMQYEPLSQDARRGALRTIEANPHWRQHPDQVEAHTQLQRLIQRDDGSTAGGRLERWSRNTNHPLAPFELGNPQASAGRIAQAQTVAGYDNGPPELMTDDEAEHYRQEWRTGGPAERAAMLAQMGAHGAGPARMLMRQLAGAARPELTNLLDLTTMRDRRAGAAIARDALDGEAAPLDARLFPQARAQAVVRERFGAAMGGRDGAQVTGIWRTATGIYAHRARLANLDRFDPDLWAASYRAAGGQAGNTGGFAVAHPGGSFAVPRGFTSDDFYEPLQNSRAILVGRFSGGVAPAYGGRLVSPTDLAANFIPMLVYDDNRVAQYQFRTASGDIVQGADGRGPFTLDMRGLHHAYMTARGHH
jgi:hypothetical protein